MPNLEAPSFSLGLDLDADSELRLPSGDNPDCSLAPYSPAVEVIDSDLDSRPDQPRVLKRLRRAADMPSTTKKLSEKPLVANGFDDEIEEFSSPEKSDVGSSTKYHSVCSSSKVPLRGLGFLATQPSLQRSSRKKGQASDAAASAVEARHDLLKFPKLTISPLRKFQLLDSDSDDHTDCIVTRKGASLGLSSASSQARHDGLNISKSISPLQIQVIDSDSDDPTAYNDTSTGAQKIDPLPKKQQSTVSDNPQNIDLWKDFFPKDGSHVSAPAFDGICKEYFQSVKDKNAAKQTCDLTESVPLAYHYFSHADPRIQKLVRNRLPFFSPSGMVNNTGNQRSNASMIDYRSQFSYEEPCKQKAPKKGGGKKSSSNSSKNKSRKYNSENNASEGWVDPKSSAAIPTSAEKQCVHAGGQPAGHWYTSPEGRKVYVSRSGQEFSGRTAYRNYLKETKAGSRKSKKKSTVKKKKDEGRCL